MSDRILGGACVVVAAGMAWAASDYVTSFSYEPVGPRAFPLLLAALIAICGIWLLIKPELKENTFRNVPLKPLAACVIAILLYAWFYQFLGFTIATALMSVPVGMAFGGSWLKSLIGGVVMGVVFFYLFDRVLDVVLPAGLLSPIL